MASSDQNKSLILHSFHRTTLAKETKIWHTEMNTSLNSSTHSRDITKSPCATNALQKSQGCKKMDVVLQMYTWAYFSLLPTVGRPS